MATRTTDADIASSLRDVKDHGMALGIKGAEYWAVENPFGPTGLHFLEVHHDGGYWVSQSTALGYWDWKTKREAHQALRVMANALHAARKAMGPTALDLLGEGPEAEDEESARNLYHRQSQWVRKNS